MSFNRRLGGNNRRRRPQSGNRFRFCFVFVSCVRASGRGEAVWVRERGVSPNAGAPNGNKGYVLRAWAVAFAFCCYLHRF